jgi:hypothetical protein
MKNVFLALAVGYVIGAKTGRKELDQLSRSMTALLGTDEFADVVVSARAQFSSTLRELASMVDGDRHIPEEGGDVVARVKSLVGAN